VQLHEYIDSLGDAEAAKRLGITPRTARNWRLRWRRPKPKDARRIEQRTRGAVTFAECYAYRD